MKKGNNKNLTIIIGVIGILLILVGLCIFIKTDSGEEKKKDTISDIFTQKLSPLELSQDKESLEGKTITVLGAFIPSEAFIYVQETKDKIYLKPANKDYCKNYDLTGVLKYNYLISRWELAVEDYNNCLD